MIVFDQGSTRKHTHTHKYARVGGGHDEARAVGRHGFGAIFISSLILLFLLLLPLLLVGVGVLVHWGKRKQNGKKRG